MHEVAKIYGDDVRFVWKHRIVHEFAVSPALAVCAAGQQGKFWEMEAAVWDALWDVSGEQPRPRAATQEEFDALFAEDGLVAVGVKLGLDEKRLRADMDGDVCKDDLTTDGALLDGLHIDGTPAFFINGRVLPGGAVPLSEFRALIDEELAKARKAVAAGTAPEAYYESLVKSGKRTVE